LRHFYFNPFVIKKLILYLAVFIISLYAVREFIYTGTRKNSSGVFEKYNTIFLKKNLYDVLFLGSSRAETHFDPSVFDSLTGFNSYNLGVTGGTPRIAYSVLRAYCSASALPKYIIFDVDLHFLKYGVDTIRNFPNYFPFLNNDELLRRFSSIDKRFASFHYNPVHSLPYSGIGLLGASLHGWLGKTGKYDSLYYKGFMKNVFNKPMQVREVTKSYSYINPLERRYMDSIIIFSRKNGIELFLVTSPIYKGGSEHLANKEQVISQMKNIALINHLNYADFTETDFSHLAELFADPYHLTGKGAALFNRRFPLLFKQYSAQKNVN